MKRERGSTVQYPPLSSARHPRHKLFLTGVRFVFPRKIGTDPDAFGLDSFACFRTPAVDFSLSLSSLARTDVSGSFRYVADTDVDQWVFSNFCADVSGYFFCIAVTDVDHWVFSNFCTDVSGSFSYVADTDVDHWVFSNFCTDVSGNFFCIAVTDVDQWVFSNFCTVSGYFFCIAVTDVNCNDVRASNTDACGSFSSIAPPDVSGFFVTMAYMILRGSFPSIACTGLRTWCAVIVGKIQRQVSRQQSTL